MTAPPEPSQAEREAWSEAEVRKRIAALETRWNVKHDPLIAWHAVSILCSRRQIENATGESQMPWPDWLVAYMMVSAAKVAELRAGRSVADIPHMAMPPRQSRGWRGVKPIADERRTITPEIAAAEVARALGFKQRKRLNVFADSNRRAKDRTIAAARDAIEQFTTAAQSDGSDLAAQNLADARRFRSEATASINDRSAERRAAKRGGASPMKRGRKPGK